MAHRLEFGVFPHQVTRLVFDTGQPYEEFRARYEDAVPEVDLKRLAEFTERGASWREVVADADAAARLGLLMYWRADMTPLMSLAGDSAPCTAYLMGNHTIAERMYRHDPSVMLYAPLRTAILWTPRAGPSSRSTSPAQCSPASPARRSPRSEPNSAVSSPTCSKRSTSQYAECSMDGPDSRRPSRHDTESGSGPGGGHRVDAPGDCYQVADRDVPGPTSLSGGEVPFGNQQPQATRMDLEL